MFVRIDVAGRLNVAVEPCASGSLPGCPSCTNAPRIPIRQHCGLNGGAERAAESLGGPDNGLSGDRAPFRTGNGEGQRERKEPRWLTRAETDAVLDAVVPSRFLLLLFAFHTGMRPSEIGSRHKEDIDLGSGFVRVRPHGEFRVKMERPRVVPLTPALREALQDRWDDLPEDGPIFTGQSLKKSLRRACAAVGIPMLNPYGTRHTFVSRWAQEGRSRDALIKIVGHRDGRMIDRIYAHFGTDELADHMARVTWRARGNVVPLRASNRPADDAR